MKVPALPPWSTLPPWMLKSSSRPLVWHPFLCAQKALGNWLLLNMTLAYARRSSSILPPVITNGTLRHLSLSMKAATEAQVGESLAVTSLLSAVTCCTYVRVVLASHGVGGI